VMVFLIDILCL